MNIKPCGICFVGVHLSFHSWDGTWQGRWLLWEQFPFPLFLWAPSPPLLGLSLPMPLVQTNAVSLTMWAAGTFHKTQPCASSGSNLSSLCLVPSFASQPELYFPVTWAVKLIGWMSWAWSQTSPVSSSVSYQLVMCLWPSFLTALDLSHLTVNQGKNSTYTVGVVVNIYYERFSHCLPQSKCLINISSNPRSCLFCIFSLQGDHGFITHLQAWIKHSGSGVDGEHFFQRNNIIIMLSTS